MNVSVWIQESNPNLEVNWNMCDKLCSVYYVTQKFTIKSERKTHNKKLGNLNLHSVAHVDGHGIGAVKVGVVTVALGWCLYIAPWCCEIDAAWSY